MRTKRMLALAMAMLLSVALLVGCATPTEPAASTAPASTAPASTAPASAAPEATPETAEPVTIKWALWDEDLTVYYKPLIEGYTALHPNVTIETVDLGSADYSTMLTTQLSGGADLDVLTIKDIPGYSNLVKQNQLEPLNSYIASSGIDTSLYGGTIEQLTVNNDVYQIPFRSDFWVIFYNKALFDAAGVAYPTNDMTLDEYDALAREMTSGSGGSKVYGNHYHTWRSAVQLFGILDGKNTIVDGKYAFLAPYYERILKEQDDGICQDYATLKTSSTHYSGVFFNNQAAMVNMGSWFIATQIDKVATGESLASEWGIVKYPHPDGVTAGTTLGTITGVGVNAKSTKKEVALDFVKYVTGAEGAAVIAATGTIPAIKNEEVIAAITSKDGFPADDNSKDALYTYKTYLEMPMHDKSADIEVILNECHEGIMTKNTTIDQGLANMEERVGVLLA